MAPCMDAHAYMALSTPTLLREAESLLLGQITHTPEAELALALLDRVEELEARVQDYEDPEE